MRNIPGTIALVIVIAAGCNGCRNSSAPPQPSAESPAQQQARKPQESAIPSDVSFSIIAADSIPDIKRSLDIRLNRKVSAETLRAIALELKAQDESAYERTLITYYLPGMTVGAGAWATTHFDPALEVRILGLTAEDEKALAAQLEPASREIIGQWLDESPFIGGRITIFREKEKLYIENAFKDGSRLTKELTEGKSPRGRRFDKVEGSSSGDHWVILPNGNLEVRDNDGPIATAKKVR